MVAQALIKQAVDDGLDGSLADGLTVERRLFVEVFATDDSQIGVTELPRARPRQGRVHRLDVGQHGMPAAARC